MTAAEIVRSNARRKTPPSRFQVVKRVEARHNMHDPVVKILADAHSGVVAGLRLIDGHLILIRHRVTMMDLFLGMAFEPAFPNFGEHRLALFLPRPQRHKTDEGLICDSAGDRCRPPPGSAHVSALMSLMPSLREQEGLE